MNGVITLILMTTIMTVNIGKAKMLRNKERREWKFTFKYWDLKAAYDELRTRFGRKAEDDALEFLSGVFADVDGIARDESIMNTNTDLYRKNAKLESQVKSLEADSAHLRQLVMEYQEKEASLNNRGMVTRLMDRIF